MDPIGERKPDPIKVELNPFKLYTGSFRDLKKGIDQRIQQGITRGLFDRNDFGKIQNLLGLKTENVDKRIIENARETYHPRINTAHDLIECLMGRKFKSPAISSEEIASDLVHRVKSMKDAYIKEAKPNDVIRIGERAMNIALSINREYTFIPEGRMNPNKRIDLEEVAKIMSKKLGEEESEELTASQKIDKMLRKLMLDDFPFNLKLIRSIYPVRPKAAEMPNIAMLVKKERHFNDLYTEGSVNSWPTMLNADVMIHMLESAQKNRPKESQGLSVKEFLDYVWPPNQANSKDQIRLTNKKSSDIS